MNYLKYIAIMQFLKKASPACNWEYVLGYASLKTQPREMLVMALDGKCPQLLNEIRRITR
jgi:hypothetical protein